MRTRIWSVLVVIGILGGIVSFNIFSTNKIREGIKRKDAIIACKENENCYMVKYSRGNTGLTYVISEGEDQGIEVTLKGNHPLLNLDLTFWDDRNEFLVYGCEKNVEEKTNPVSSVENIVDSYTIDVERWEFVTPIYRDYTYSSSGRTFYPKGYIDSYDLEQAGYKEILAGENSTVRYDSEMKGTVVRRETEDGYEVDLYDKLGNRIETRWFPKEPGVRDITDDLVEISISVGSPACYYTYYDRKREKISDTFFNSFLVDNKYVVYMEDAGELIIKDLFDEGLLEKKIVRDFAGIDPRSSVDVELTDEGEVIIEYLTGEDYEVVMETIPLY